MSIAFEIGQRIRFYRKKKHLTQEQLAELCNFHPTYIGQLERGEKNATLESIYKVAQSLNISLSQLFENIEQYENSTDNIPFRIYQQLIKLPLEKQKKMEKIFQEIFSILQ
ncbi:hypothetical protein B5F29_13495 [Lachnoclostridium sp. An196]|uniref:helix-turn-helix domain-containing protein n=1 Tax=Lachnoclostridium sp. An196 TaxID=1965583 RepID=UPI000B38524F|nr:helix-turn-helix transcriptional regulator [Lachnoclostridium sp. An196]OUP17606.1 hypothetical protein B5F29_13495 [Lachnoclostridium sp. An196]